MKRKRSLHKTRSAQVQPVPREPSRLPWIVIGLAAIYILAGLIIPSSNKGFNLRRFGELPVLNGGRLKPLDTLARSALLVISGKQTIRHENEKISADQWLLDMLTRPRLADERPVFQIDDPDVLGLMGIQQTTKRRFSLADIHPYLQTIEDQASLANQVKDKSRFQSAILNLHGQIDLYHRLQNTLDMAGREHALAHLEHTYSDMKSVMASHMQNKSKFGSDDLKKFSDVINEYSALNQMAAFYPLPVSGQELSQVVWISPGQAMLQSVAGPNLHPGLVAYAAMGDAVRDENEQLFNRTVDDFTDWLKHNVASAVFRSQMEYRFNHAAFFYRSLILYGVVFLLVMISWLSARLQYLASAHLLLTFTFAVHTIGLVLRMILQGRPPVTNLYSSAIFVGWVAVFLGMFLEKYSKRGVGTAVSALIGFITLIIAHNLSVQGDTLEMMRAVLDSNFWLATHVVAITVGYGSTFLAGALGILYVLRARFDRGWNEESAASLEKMAYGIVCFSLFFSFTGTILGGIWADQSWGRFWGWDPKENGALMIVLWNAFILHARWSKVAGERGIMVMTIFGNIVTSLSWFGVNMLGIGLHSYGFMDKAFFWLIVFVVTQVVLMLLSYMGGKINVKRV